MDCCRVSKTILTQMHRKSLFNSFLASGDFCHLLITFPNMDPDLDPNHLPLILFLIKVNRLTTKNMQKLPGMQRDKI